MSADPGIPSPDPDGVFFNPEASFKVQPTKNFHRRPGEKPSILNTRPNDFTFPEDRFTDADPNFPQDDPVLRKLPEPAVRFNPVPKNYVNTAHAALGGSANPCPEPILGGDYGLFRVDGGASREDERSFEASSADESDEDLYTPDQQMSPHAGFGWPTYLRGSGADDLREGEHRAMGGHSPDGHPGHFSPRGTSLARGGFGGRACAYPTSFRRPSSFASLTVPCPQIACVRCRAKSPANLVAERSST